MPVYFEITGALESVETIAVSGGIRDLRRLNKLYGTGRWRKRRGFAKVRLADGTICLAELHWCELSWIGKKEIKIKRILG